MGKYFFSGETVRIDFEDGNWVDVKQELTQADQDYIINAMAKTKGTEIQLDLGKMALLERSVVAWSFAEDDKSIPVTKENLSNLRRAYREKVLEEIDRLNTVAGAYLAKNLPTASM